VQFDFICDSDSQAIPEEEIKKLGGRVYKVAPYQNIVRNMSDMKRIFEQNQYSVVHAYNSTMNLFPMAVAKSCNVPVRISESLSMAHEGDWKTVLKKMLRPMSKWFANYYMSCGEDCGRWQFGDKLFDEGKVDVFKTVVNTEYNTEDYSNGRVESYGARTGDLRGDGTDPGNDQVHPNPLCNLSATFRRSQGFQNRYRAECRQQHGYLHCLSDPAWLRLCCNAPLMLVLRFNHRRR
jgi:hypothetical protein